MTTMALYPEVAAFLSSPKKLLIGDQWVEAASGKTFETLNPATGEILAYVAEGDQEDVNRAVRTARHAFDEGPWSRVTPAERSRLIWKLADLIEEHGHLFAQLETLDNGKPFAVAKRDDIGQTVDLFRYYAGWPTKILGDTVPVSTPNIFGYTRREPVGVCAAIVPWNYPLMMAAWKLAPALAAGCTVVLKPAEQTPLSALLLGQLILDAGIPAGVVNVVTGFGVTAGAALSAHPDVDKIAFTGSTEVGRLILQAAGKSNLKKVSLELGGKSPNIIFADADIEAAKAGAAGGIFYNMGQDCTAGTRVFVEYPLYEEVVHALADSGRSLKIGNGLDAASEMGPLVSQEQLERVTRYVHMGTQEGAHAVSGGKRVSTGDLAKGYFVEPTVFAGVHNNMRIAQEEIFGPVVSVIPFRDVEDVVRQGNAVSYGLGAGLWTNNLQKAHKVAAALKAGSVWINIYNANDPAMPFGGYKQSGMGREMGFEAIELYTEVKSVWVNLGDALQGKSCI